VRPVERAGTEANYQFAIAIEFLNRINRCADWINTTFRASAIQHPHAFAVGIYFYANHLAPRPLRGKLRPVLHDAEWIGWRIDILRVGQPISEGDSQNSADHNDARELSISFHFAF